MSGASDVLLIGTGPSSGPASQPVITPAGPSSPSPSTITYVIGICLMVVVALALAALACILRRKHKRNQALMAAEREARLAALRQAEALEAARLAELGLYPHKPPVVVVQPDGEATLAEQLGASMPTFLSVVAGPPEVGPAPGPPHVVHPPAAGPAADTSMPPQAQQVALAMQSFLQQQQLALAAQARGAHRGAPPDWRQAVLPRCSPQPQPQRSD